MEPVKVPQHLELDDVIAWGLGAVDLACIAAGALMAWWIWDFTPAGLDLRTALAAPFAATGLTFGVVRLGNRSLREWALLVAAFVLRARLLLTGGRA